MLTSKYKHKLKTFKGTKPSNIPATFKNPQLSSDIQNLLNKLFYKLLHKNQQYGMRWIIGFERYIESINNSVSNPFKRHLRRGHVVEVELFGHFNSELTFLHPAIVLFDNGTKHILVAPISTSLYKDTNTLHIDIGVAEGLKHDCGIALDEILMIHSDRIIFQYDDGNGSPVKVPDYILDKIDSIIIKEFTPQFFKKYNANEQALTSKEQEILNLKNENENLQNEITKLQGTLKELEKTQVNV